MKRHGTKGSGSEWGSQVKAASAKRHGWCFRAGLTFVAADPAYVRLALIVQLSYGGAAELDVRRKSARRKELRQVRRHGPKGSALRVGACERNRGRVKLAQLALQGMPNMRCSGPRLATVRSLVRSRRGGAAELDVRPKSARRKGPGWLKRHGTKGWVQNGARKWIRQCETVRLALQGLPNTRSSGPRPRDGSVIDSAALRAGR